MDTLSPKLKKLLTDKPAAFRALTNALVESFPTNTARIYYFYTSDESEESAFHFYPNRGGMADVFICVRENQPPLDEFLCLFFETVNTRGQERFANLCDAAKNGTILRAEFAKEILKVEFEAIKKTQTVLATLKFTKRQTADSWHYRRFTDCPAEFDDDLTCIKKTSLPRDPIKEYELQYDWLRKKPVNSEQQRDSIAPSNVDWIVWQRKFGPQRRSAS